MDAKLSSPGLANIVERILVGNDLETAIRQLIKATKDKTNRSPLHMAIKDTFTTFASLLTEGISVTTNVLIIRFWQNVCGGDSKAQDTLVDLSAHLLVIEELMRYDRCDSRASWKALSNLVCQNARCARIIWKELYPKKIIQCAETTPVDCLGLMCAFLLSVISAEPGSLVFTEKPAVHLLATILHSYANARPIGEKTEIPNFEFAIHLLVKLIFVPPPKANDTLVFDPPPLDSYLLNSLEAYKGSLCSIEIIACLELIEATIQQRKTDLAWLKSESVLRATTWGILALSRLDKSQLTHSGDDDAIEMAHSVLHCTGDLTSWIGEDSAALKKAGELWLPTISELLKHFNTVDPSAQRKTKGKETEKPKSPYALKRGFIRLVGNLAYRCRENQDIIREAGLLGPILNSSVLDDNNPYIQQWAVLAIRNLTENNEENKKEIERIAPKKTLKHQKKAMKDLMSQSRGGGVKIGDTSSADLVEELKRNGVNVSTVEM